MLTESKEGKKPIYVGKDQDQIDLCLANFLNQYPDKEKLKI